MRGFYILNKASCNWIKRYLYLNVFLCVISYQISNQPIKDLIWDILQCQVTALSCTISWSLSPQVKLLNGHHKVRGTHIPLSLMQKQRLFSIMSQRGFSKIVKHIAHHRLQESMLNIQIQARLPQQILNLFFDLFTFVQCLWNGRGYFFVSNFRLLTYYLAYCSKSSSNQLYVLA